MALEDKLNQAKGALKENAGKLTGDKQLEVEGTIENTVAKVKDVAKDAVEGAISGLKNALSDNDDNDK